MDIFRFTVTKRMVAYKLIHNHYQKIYTVIWTRNTPTRNTPLLNNAVNVYAII